MGSVLNSNARKIRARGGHPSAYPPPEEDTGALRNTLDSIKHVLEELPEADNVEPYPFEWLDYEQTAKEYSALLVRVSRMYDQRFGT